MAQKHHSGPALQMCWYKNPPGDTYQDVGGGFLEVPYTRCMDVLGKTTAKAIQQQCQQPWNQHTARAVTLLKCHYGICHPPQGSLWVPQEVMFGSRSGSRDGEKNLPWADNIGRLAFAEVGAVWLQWAMCCYGLGASQCFSVLHF